jgi:death on curing protein
VTRYIGFEDVLTYCADRGLELRDPGLLASAVARPQASMFGQDAYPSLADKAAALFCTVAQNQALADGNQRLALLCGHTFLGLNGHRMGISHADLGRLLAIDIPGGLNDIPTIAARLDIQPIAGE